MRIARAFCFTLPLLALSNLSAHAASVVVDRELSPGESVSGASFDADLRLGRAWVVVDFLEHGGEEDLVHSQRLSLPGLTYDAATRTIHLQDGGRDVTCAVGKKVLWATRFQTTQQCPIRVQQVPQARVYGALSEEKARFAVEVGTAP
jgi:hypothetical protein